MVVGDESRASLGTQCSEDADRSPPSRGRRQYTPASLPVVGSETSCGTPRRIIDGPGTVPIHLGDPYIALVSGGRICSGHGAGHSVPRFPAPNQGERRGTAAGDGAP